MAQTRPKIKYSVRLVFIGIFFAFIAVTVGMLNVYPTTTARDVVFSAKQSALLSRAGVMSSSLSALEKLSPEGVTQVMGLVGAEDYERAVVSDQDGMVLYDTDPMGGILGTMSESELMLRSLEGVAAFACRYDGDAFWSRAAAPVISYGRVIGAVYVSERDDEQPHPHAGGRHARRPRGGLRLPRAAEGARRGAGAQRGVQRHDRAPAGDG